MGLSGTGPDRLRALLLWGLASVSRLYESEPDGRRVFRGVRPGPEWHRHGTFERTLFTLREGELVRVTVHKQRWRRRGTTATVHSRPPDDLASVWFCSLVVATSLWGWVTGPDGLHRHEPALPALAERPSTRTVQRWLARAQVHADETATALRRAVLERSEPRPMESHVGGGLSPPCRRWGSSPAVTKLHSSLSLLYEGAAALDVHVSVLLAEARGRQHIRPTGWLI